MTHDQNVPEENMPRFKDDSDNDADIPRKVSHDYFFHIKSKL